MKATLLFLCILIVGCTPQAQKESNEIKEKEIDGYVESFFTKYRDAGTGEAIDYIASTNKKLQGLGTLKFKIDSVRSRAGSFTGYSEITKKKAAEGLILFSYLVKHEDQPMRFTFVFYKPRANWMLYDIEIDTDVINDLVTSGKIYLAN